MKVIILQTDICWADPEENLKRADKMMDACPGADLYVLPEMFSTGFCTRPEGVAEPAGDGSLEWMKRKAAAGNCAVAGSIATEDGGKYYNRFYFVCPDGTVYRYDKRHLFTFGGEDKRYTPGGERVIVSYGGFRILLQICYDLRFPVWSRCRGDYDVAIYVANWPVGRREVWDTLLRARALENQCYVVGVNRTGHDPQCSYNGGSVIINPYGKLMASCEDDKEETASAVLAREPLDTFRKHFPVLGDGDDFNLSL